MRKLSNVELLDVWEAGSSQTTVERALALIASAEPDVPVEKLARLSVGERDRRLFLLRKETFGDTLALTASCPACAEQVEANVRIDDLLLDGAWRTGNPACSDRQECLSSTAGHEVRFRLPNSIDLAAVAEAEGDDAALRLLASCVVEARRGGEAVAVDALPDDVVTAVADRMSELDPQADVELALRCPSCAHAWVAPFDIVTFFWSEIHYWAQRILREVHALARAYAWSERDILRMSARRRQAYLDLAGGEP